MKKIKNLWVENRVLFVLFIIVLLWIIIILGVMTKYFFGSSKSSYGDRLDGIENVEITNDIKDDYINTLKEDEKIEDVTFISKGRVIYITILYTKDITLVEAESKALSSMDLFLEDYTTYYDYNFTLKQEASEASDGFLIMGARNANGSGLIWNNNTEFKSGE